MKAIDTNIVLRFLTADGDRQYALATECISTGVFVPHSVLIETEWVLRSGYGWDVQRINVALADLIAMDCIEVDQVDALHWALDRYRQGADWADMLHLVASTGHTAFSTFDRGLAKEAGGDPPLTVELLR
jgi:predicted nucleic-acid-binding protein